MARRLARSSAPTRIHLSNQEIAHILYEIADYLEMQDVAFKPRAYERVGRAVEALREPLSELYRRGGRKALEEIPGVGSSIAEKLEELITRGKLRYYEALKRKTPVDVEGLSAIEGVGPKTIKLLWQKLGVKTVSDLERAARAGKLRNLPGFGEKSEEKILQGIAFRREHGNRFLLSEALPLARMIEERLRKLPGVEAAVVAGSILRRKETVGDGDILVVSDEPKKVTEYFVAMPEVSHVYGSGETKTMVRFRNGMDFDLRIVPRESFGAALNYFTGSKDHNVALRQRAIKRGWKLNEYGLFQRSRGGWRMIAGRREEEIYRKLGLAFIVPEMREMTGELEQARRQFGKTEEALPGIVGYGDLRGDLQVQSNWTDGANSIEELAREAQRAGLEYIAITDHTKYLAMTHGLSEKRLLKQMAAIDRLNRTLSGITILKGTECDILKDGTLDLPDRILAKLDIVGVSVHSYFSMSREEMTKRIIRAISNPHVDILFHPTGRIIGKRKPYEVDIEALIRAAKRTGTILEANAYPERLDLNDTHVRMAVEAGVKIAINSDAHATTHFAFLEYGIAQARRGWARKSDVINAWPLEKMRKMLKRAKRTSQRS
jgi:DNA polymerase (family 10)